VVIFDKDRDSHITHIKQFLHRCQDRQISLNRDKYTFCQTTITFAGFKLSSEGYRVDLSITAISSFPAPSSLSDLHSFFGLVNQLSSSTDIVSTTALSGSAVESVWLQDLRQQADLDEEYQQLKGIIMQGFPNNRGVF